MRVLLDEDVPLPAVGLLQHVLPGHEVRHVVELKWAGKKDRPLLQDASARGFQVIVTNDANQLNDPDECAAIKASGMHHVRYPHKKRGPEGLALAVAGVFAAMPPIMRELEHAEGQRTVRITAVSPADRYKIEDPRQATPYWP